MLIPNRHGNSPAYRYGFNGMEKDDELKGEGNSYYTHHRLLDTRIGKWLSNDPEMQKYPDMSPYSAFANNPIIVQDVRGDTIRIVGSASYRYATLKELQTLTNDKLEFDKDGQTILITKLNGANEGKDLKNGTGLIRELNKKNNEALPTVTIESVTSFEGSKLTEEALDGAARLANRETKNEPYKIKESEGNKTLPEIRDDGSMKDGKKGKGAKSTVYFNRHGETRGDVTRAKRLGLAHELVHAILFGKGLADPKKIKGVLDPESKMVHLTKEEWLTRFIENSINQEQKKANPDIEIGPERNTNGIKKEDVDQKVIE